MKWTVSLLLGAAWWACGCGAGGPRSADTAANHLDAAALLESGRAFADAGDVIRAEQYLASALSRGAPEAQVMPSLLSVCVAAKHYRLAADYAERALTHDPRNARLRFLVGALYVSIGDRARARDALERSARELRGDADVQFQTAVFFRDDMADPFAADLHFRDYLRLDPHGPHAEEARASLVEHVE